jgi:hypothetical protein
MASLFRLVLKISLRQLQADTIGLFERCRNWIGFAAVGKNPCCLRYFRLLERRLQGINDGS